MADTGMKAEIAVIGGTGFYQFIDNAIETTVNTPYGFTSDSISLGSMWGKKIAFLPRHGKHHQHPPHMVNYRANLWALKQLGVSRIIGPCAVGSLKPTIHPGHFVFCHQFVDRTSGRKDTFFDGPKTVHLSAADPYCDELRKIGIGAAQRLGIDYHGEGTMVVIQGPRFSTRSESKWFSQMGWEVVNMTGYPEVMLARELGMCYLNVSLITDYDIGLEGRPDVKPVTAEEVTKVFTEHNEILKNLVKEIIRETPVVPGCLCHEELKRILT